MLDYRLSKSLLQVVKLLACAVILKITGGVLLSYQSYLPPSFNAQFLQGREAYFWEGYQWAFYLHIFSGPCSLVLGTVLISEWFRMRFALWHRILGRLQVACVLLMVAPSGIWMALYAETGAVAGLGFALLGAATGMCAVLGWRSAVKRRFIAHRRWMLRCFLLLCSAVVLRVMGGFFQVVGAEGDWTYALAAWMSWLAPLTMLELIYLGSKPAQIKRAPVEAS